MPNSFILVTGAAGFIPSSLCHELIKDKNNFVVGVDNFSTGRQQNLPVSDNFIFIKADINSILDVSQIMLSYRFNYVFHYAAVVGVKRTLENPILVLQDIVGIQELLRLSKNTGVKRFFFSSSSEVYGEPVEVPQNEATTPLNSRLPYAVVKNVGEVFIKAFSQEYGLNYTIFRFFNTYGPNQSSDFVVSRFLRSALSNKEITIYGDGRQTRTFCYIEDNISATTRCLHDHSSINQTINIGSDIETSIIDLAKIVINITDSKSKVVHLPPLAEGDMRRRMPDIRIMERILGRSPISLESGLSLILKTIK